MQKWIPYTKQKISTPENVPRLFDLISVKNEDVLPAFYFALGDTLVANDLEQATRVGLQGSSRHRVVTLKGELIDLSGTMSGGGGKVLKGRMGQSITENVSQEEIDQLNKKVEALVTELANLKKLKLELKEIIEQASKEINTLEHLIKKSQMNYESYTDQEKNLKLQIKEQENKIIAAMPDKKQVKNFEKKIDHHQKNYNEATNAASVVENKVKSIQEKILAVTKGKYGAAQKKIDALVQEINKISQNITKNTVLLKNSDKNLKKSEEKIASLKNEMEKYEKEKEALVQEFKSLELRGTEVSEKKKEAEEALTSQEDLKMKVAMEVKTLQGGVNQVKSEMVEFKNEIKLTDIKIRASDGKVKELKSQLSKLKLQEIENGPTDLPTLTSEEIDHIDTNKLNYEIGCLKKQINDMNPDLRAIAEFKKKEEMYHAKLKDLKMTEAEFNHCRQSYETLRRIRIQEFMKGFNIIALKVKELYQMITLGGDAELELIDSLDPFSEGIEYSIRPLRKCWKMVRNLSGGEKTLSSLALVFALHYYRTTPFFVMDEIDAALDYRNVSIIGSYIKDCTKNAQFIIISLRDNMFLLADHLIGIYKTNDRTQNVYLSSLTELEKNFNLTGVTSIELTGDENNPPENEKRNRVTFQTTEKENDFQPSTKKTYNTPRKNMSQTNEQICSPLTNRNKGDENSMILLVEDINLLDDDSFIIRENSDKYNNVIESNNLSIIKE